jgi:type IV pilus assembly protein PilN
MIRINLLPIRAQRRKENLRQHVVVVVGGAVIVLLLLAMAALKLRSDVSDMEKKIVDRKQTIKQLELTIKEVQGYNAKKADLEEKIGVISALEERQRGPSQVFFELAHLAPDKLWIEKMSDNNGAFSLEGVAIDNQTVAQYILRLEESPLFQNVRLIVTRQVVKGGVPLKSFTLEAQIVYPKSKQAG